VPRISHFDIPVDDPERAQNFYSKVFDWKFEKWDGPMDYWMAKTGGTRNRWRNVKKNARTDGHDKHD